MSNRKAAILATLVIMIILVITALYTHSFDKPLLISRTDPPKVKVDEKQHSFGSVEEGNEIPHVFKIQNIGGQPLTLSADTSCGCTELDLLSQKVLPGESTELKVTMDTSLKKGDVKKEINLHTNDPKNKLIILVVSATILPRSANSLLPQIGNANTTGGIQLNGDNPDVKNTDPHSMLDKTKPIKLFVGKCATCHVQQGIGKKGEDLFIADCAMCHGLDAKGKVGPSLLGDYSNRQFRQAMSDVVKFGSKTHPSMPAFSKVAGGPLSNDDIESLINYLDKSSKASK